MRRTARGRSALRRPAAFGARRSARGRRQAKRAGAWLHCWPDRPPGTPRSGTGAWGTTAAGASVTGRWAAAARRSSSPRCPPIPWGGLVPARLDQPAGVVDEQGVQVVVAEACLAQVGRQVGLDVVVAPAAMGVQA